MVGQIGVGLLGLGYHTLANLAGPSASWVDNFLYGAPAFAPLLFVNLALLALIGLWGLARSLSPAPGASRLMAPLSAGDLPAAQRLHRGSSESNEDQPWRHPK
jgi:hypothetical protein